MIEIMKKSQIRCHINEYRIFLARVCQKTLNIANPTSNYMCFLLYTIT